MEELYQNMNLFPKFPIEDKEELLKAVVVRLTEIEMSLRLRGDHWRANKLKQFTKEYFLDPNSNFEELEKLGERVYRFKQS